ncbi:zinc finger protein 275-like [Cololabis saira]|uniref:zinc finger protein 275-like n=1 Tax=Cololabis saira TaxID=129043 RepID=UPI002AD525BA|nr:zinc finger protein 275-like [Cololabis saira]
MLGRQNVNSTVKRALLFNQSIIENIRTKYGTAKTNRDKQLITKVLSGNILRKYKLQKYARESFGYSKKRDPYTEDLTYHARRCSRLRSEIMKTTTSFFLRDDVSRMTTGRKQTVTRLKKKMQKRLLTNTMKNLHRKFLSEHIGDVSYTTFCRLRPFWVVTPSSSDHDTCLCKRHENLQFMANALQSQGLLSSRNIEEMSEATMCDPKAKTCAYELPEDIMQVLVTKEDIPWNSSRDQQDLDHLHIKKEEEEVCTGREDERFNQLEDTDTRLPFTVVIVKSEDEEDEPQSSKLHQVKTEDGTDKAPPSSSSDEQMKTETHGEDWGGPQPIMNPDLNIYFQKNTTLKISDSSETEVSDDDYWRRSSDFGPEANNADDFWEQTMLPGAGVNPDAGCSAAKKPLVCSDCGKHFPYKYYLEKHMRVHTGEKPFVCGTCGKSFSQNQNLNAHMRLHTGEKPFACEDCGKRFNLNTHLKTHMRVHTGEKPFACDYCGKRFSVQVTLSKHLMVHSGVKPFICHICGKRFPRTNELKTHMRTHTGEKPFVCGTCGKGFCQNSNLKSHVKVHTGEKPFSCEDCGKRFRERRNLTEHVRVHTGEKPFVCKDCSKGFTRSEALKKHMDVHARAKSFSCHDCGKMFHQEPKLRSHMRIHLVERDPACCEN